MCHYESIKSAQHNIICINNMKKLLFSVITLVYDHLSKVHSHWSSINKERNRKKASQLY